MSPPPGESEPRDERATDPTATPPPLREGVRGAVLASLRRDFELRAGPTARRLVAAGAVGVPGALGATLLLAGHPYGHHPPWHVTVFSTLWAGLLVVALALVFLRVRTPRLAIGAAAQVAVLSLGLAGICSLLCPDQHFLHWWSRTPAGSWLTGTAGPPLSALCFGLATTAIFAALSTALVARRLSPGRRGSLLAAALTWLLLAPGVALQAVGTTPAIFAGWLGGAAVGAYLGVAGILAGRARRSA